MVLYFYKLPSWLGRITCISMAETNKGYTEVQTTDDFEHSGEMCTDSRFNVDIDSVSKLFGYGRRSDAIRYLKTHYKRGSSLYRSLVDVF